MVTTDRREYWRFGCDTCGTEAIVRFPPGFDRANQTWNCPGCARLGRVIEKPSHVDEEKVAPVTDMYARRRQQLLMDLSTKDVT